MKTSITTDCIVQSAAPSVPAHGGDGTAPGNGSFEPRELRDLSWQVGMRYPGSFCMEGISFLPVSCNNACVQWHVNDGTVSRLMGEHGPAWHGAKPVLRIYDVTDIEFSGFNAHRHYDIAIGTLSGTYYLKVDQHGRNFLIEMGFRFTNGQFAPCVRSNTLRFDRPARSAARSVSGLYVGGGFGRVFRIKNVLDALFFAQMEKALREADNPALRTAIFLSESAVAASSGPCGPIAGSLTRIAETCSAMGVAARLFICEHDALSEAGSRDLPERADAAARGIVRKFTEAHSRTPFTCIQFHDWYSAPAAIEAASRYGLPLICMLHSTEGERSGARSGGELSRRIRERERAAFEAAARILVARESTRDAVLHEYGAPRVPIGIVPVLFDETKGDTGIGSEVRSRYGIGDGGPVVLFAGEIAHHTGADLLVEAIVDVSREFAHAQFVFAGEGYLKEELSRRAWHAGIGRRCHFLGDVPGDTFGRLLTTCDFLALPARARLDAGLAERAIHEGKPVLTTHQTGLAAVRHGVNGVVIYDNPGSVTWGLREMLNNPPMLSGGLRRANHPGGAESIAALYISHWASVAAERDRKDDRAA